MKARGSSKEKSWTGTKWSKRREAVRELRYLICQKPNLIRTSGKLKAVPLIALKIRIRIMKVSNTRRKKMRSWRK